MSVLVTPASYKVQNLTEYSAVVVRVNGGRLRVVNNPSIAYFPNSGGITVRGRSDKTVKSSHADAAIVTYYKDGKAVDKPMPEVDQAVILAATMLDGLREDWADYVNLDTLVMWDSENCILGQVFRDKADDGENGYDWAFDQGLVKGKPWTPAFVGLREDWVRLIEYRRSL